MYEGYFFRVFFVLFIALHWILLLNISYATNQTQDDTVYLEDRINSLDQKVNQLEQEQKKGWKDLLDFLFNFPLHFITTIFSKLVLIPLGFGDDGQVWGVYQQIYTMRPDFSNLEGGVTDFSRQLLSVYVLVLVIYSLYALYAGIIGRAELKEGLVRIIIGALLLVNAYPIYNILIDLMNALTKTFTSYIDFSLLSLTTKTFITNIDVITILIVFSIILGQLLGVAVLLVELIYLWLFPLIILSLSMPFQKVQNFGETLLNILIGVLLAPTVSAIALAIVPAALKTTSGLSSIIINRLILLCGILLAIILPLVVILAVTIRPVIKVVAVYKLMKLKVVK